MSSEPREESVGLASLGSLGLFGAAQEDKGQEVNGWPL